LFLQECGQATELLGPEPFVAIEPLERLAHRRGVETAGDAAPCFPARDQTGIRKHVEMLHDRRQRDFERLGQRADRQAGLFGKPHHQRPPRRIGERGKSAIERPSINLNHLVKYRPAPHRVKLWRPDSSVLKLQGHNRGIGESSVMDTTSPLTALIGAQTGQLQLAVAVGAPA
jgi:hypothetical protein